MNNLAGHGRSGPRVAGDQSARMIAFARQSGMRQEECASMTRPRLRLHDKAVHLVNTKTGRPRSVELSDEAVGTLVSTPAHLNSDVIFWHDDGRRYHNVPSRFGRFIKRAIMVVDEGNSAQV